LELLEWLYHESTGAELLPLGFRTTKAAHKKLVTLSEQGTIHKLGSVRLGNGKPFDVFCTRKSKRDNLLHNVLTSKFVQPWVLAGAECVRGDHVDKKFASDAEMIWNGEKFFIELDRATEHKRQVHTRMKRYINCDGWILFVTTDARRIKSLKPELKIVANKVLFTTVKESRGTETVFEDIYGDTTKI